MNTHEYLQKRRERLKHEKAATQSAIVYLMKIGSLNELERMEKELCQLTHSPQRR